MRERVCSERRRVGATNRSTSCSKFLFRTCNFCMRISVVVVDCALLADVGASIVDPSDESGLGVVEREEEVLGRIGESV